MTSKADQKLALEDKIGGLDWDLYRLERKYSKEVGYKVEDDKNYQRLLVLRAEAQAAYDKVK